MQKSEAVSQYILKQDNYQNDFFICVSSFLENFQL